MQPRTMGTAQRAEKAGIVDQDRRGRIGLGQALQRIGAAVQKPHRSARRHVRHRGQPGPLAALGRACHPHRQVIALAASGGACAVRQETFGIRQGHEGACHGWHPGRDPAHMHITQPIRRAGPPDGVFGHLLAFQHRNPHLARADGGENPGQGRSHPRPRSSCAVSYKGSPTTPE